MPVKDEDKRSPGARRGQMRWFCLAAAAVLSMISLPASAQNDEVQRDLKAVPGEATRIGIYTNVKPDCTSGPLPQIRLVTPPAHGVVRVRRGTAKLTNVKQCLATLVPVFAAFYLPAGSFTGPDEFKLEISTSEGGKQVQHFRVTVSAPGSEKGSEKL
jgi:hypothetical protein